MLRFAPSPTGDMHIGNLRVALFNSLLSIQRDEQLMVRIEDSDTVRNVEGKDREILEILDLFGIEYSTVLHQSNNLKFHRLMAVDLLHKKRAFNCFCTPDELEAKRESAKQQKRAFRYDDTCTALTAQESIDNSKPFTIRIKRVDHKIEFTDLIKGSMSFEPEDIDSFIIMRAQKLPTYNFACAVDDMLSDISLVIRGEDHLSNTPKQIAIRDALGYDKSIEYAHLPIILNTNGKKMSKRDDASSVKWLLSEGFLPSAITNYLLLLGNKTPSDIFTFKEAVEWFDITKISKSSAKFDIDMLRYINRSHLKALDDTELSRYVGFADADIGGVAKLFLDECSTTKELKERVGAIFGDKTVPEEFEKSVEVIKNSLVDAPHFEEFGEFKEFVIQSTGIKGKQLFKSLRILLSNSEHGPELDEIYKYLKNYIGEIVR